MGIQVSRILQLICALVVLAGAILLLMAIHRGAHVGLKDLSYHADEWWKGERADEPPKQAIHAQPQAHYTVVHNDVKKECQECKERMARYRADVLTPQIIVKNIQNVLELPRR